ncbi:carbohydrate-binding module family 20 domain-containing protein [Paractinoplanes rishiriensis]|uniref:alpha-amylase n=1 Tax=Paractinoplanes rishiriensis TaxID=1050105 RepID=A0A919MY31_9ACTN|nr:carbohydrate-binding module family 20 domain-containing protein [Actinoplanes rishiriensis]GIE99369.1 hypothetical protein Ari01nite_68340 [Actinoplanes rishiriensis]
MRVRLFVSSTFADLGAERDALHRDVFPRVRRFCAERGIPFSAVDLRWGVSPAAGLDQATVPICLAEVERCHPHFLLLIGDRYGWCPLPPRLPAGELDAVRAGLDDAGRELAGRWYRRDDNAVPPEYVLQPRDGAFAADDAWHDEEERLRAVLIDGARRAGRPVHRFSTSITEQEVAAAAPGTVHCFVRTGPTPPAELARFTAGLRATLPAGRLHEYSAGDLSAFCAAVHDALTGAIGAELAGRTTTTGPAAERARHEQFAAERRRDHRARDRELAAVARYLAGDDGRPLLVVGPSGVGKSAFLAQAAMLAAAEHPDAQLVVRFAGATARAAREQSLLSDLLVEVRAQTHRRDEPPPERMGALLDDYRVEAGLPRQGRLLIFVDAVDQLDSPGLSWLGMSGGSAVRTVVSCSDGTVADRLPGDGPRLRLEPLPPSASGALLDTWLAGARRRLRPEQRAAVLGSAATGLPLHLRLAFEEARRWASYAPAEPVPDTVPAVIDRLFARLSREAEHGAVLVGRALGYLAAARSGLTEEELLDVLSADEDVLADLRRRFPHAPVADRVPDAVWARLRADLSPYLTEHEDGGRTLLGFYHRQLAEAARRAFLDGVAARRHAALAGYFGPRPLVPRALDELVYQQVRAGQWDAAQETLTDIGYLTGRAERSGFDAVVADLRFAAEAAPAGHPLVAAAGGVERVLERDGHLFSDLAGAHGPELLAQQVLLVAGEFGLDRLADAARGLLAGSGRTHLLPRWVRGSTAGHGLARTVDGHPGEVYRVVAVPDGSAALTFATDVRWLDNGSTEEFPDPPRLWDLRTWTVAHTFGEFTGDQPRAAAVTPDSRYAVLVAEGHLLVWDLARRRLAGRHPAEGDLTVFGTPDGGRYAMFGPAAVLWPVTGPAEPVRVAENLGALAVTTDGRLAVVRRGADPLTVWDLTRDRPRHDLAGARGAGSFDLDPAGRRAAGFAGGDLAVWDVASGARERVVTVPDRARGCVVTADGGHAVLGDGHRLFVVRLGDGRCHSLGGLDTEAGTPVRAARPAEVFTVRRGGFRQWHVGTPPAAPGPAGNSGRVVHAAVLDGGRLGATVGFGGDIVVWDLATGDPVHRLDSPGIYPFAVAPDGRHAIAGRTRWDLIDGREAGPADGYGDAVTFLPDGRVLTAYADHRLRIAGPVTGAPDRTLPPTPGQPDRTSHVLATPDGRTVLVVMGWDVFELDVERGAYVEHWARPSIRYLRYQQGQRFTAAALAPDGGWVLVAKGHGVDAWELERKDLVHRFDHGAEVADFKITEDGLLLVAGGGNAVSVWDVRTRERLARAELANEVTAVATTIDGGAILAGGAAGAVHCLRLTGRSAGPLVPYAFRVEHRTEPGEDVHVVGDLPELGGGDPARAVRLTWTPGHVWRGTVAVPPSGPGRYRCFVRKGGEPPIWLQPRSRSA